MKRSEAFPSQYVSKDDVEVPKAWTIETIAPVEMPSDDGSKTKSPPVMFFHEADAKPLILNNTNWMTIEDLYGPESNEWKGHKIELYNDPSVMFGNKRVGGVRVRKPATSIYTIDDLKALREQITAKGGKVETLHASQIAKPEQIAVLMEKHQILLAELTAKDL